MGVRSRSNSTTPSRSRYENTPWCRVPESGQASDEAEPSIGMCQPHFIGEKILETNRCLVSTVSHTYQQRLMGDLLVGASYDHTSVGCLYATEDQAAICGMREAETGGDLAGPSCSGPMPVWPFQI
jgi:hypothetical protein